MQYKEIVINNQKIAYYEHGSKGRPVLFVHGNSMSGLSFERQFKSSLAERYRLVAIDLPGHGLSAKAEDPKTAYTLPGYADVLCAFVRSLDLERSVLVGWSLGGHILLEAIDRLEEAAGLMIFGTPPVGKPMAADAFLPHPLLPLAFKNELSNEEAVALTAGFFKPDARIPDFFFQDMRRTDGRAREALGACVAGGTYRDEVQVAAGLDRPLAIVHGEKETVANLSYLKGLGIPALWRGEVQMIPDAGHSPQWEQAERFNRLLTIFIAYCNHGNNAA